MTTEWGREEGSAVMDVREVRVSVSKLSLKRTSSRKGSCRSTKSSSRLLRVPLCPALFGMSCDVTTRSCDPFTLIGGESRGKFWGSDFNRLVVFRFLLGGGTGVGESPRWFTAGSAREFPIAGGESPGCSGELWVVSDDEGGVDSSGGGDKRGGCLGCCT